MYFERLALASVAALAAVPAARAADAVVIAEPEPMEYVQVCDTYGVGFYYIPGTETCLKLSGYIRTDIGAGAFGLTDVVDKKAFYLDDDFWDRWYTDRESVLNNTYDVLTRFQLRADARAETEFGTARAYAAVNFEYRTSTLDDVGFYDDWFTVVGDAVSVEHAYVELAGFRVGKTDSLFTTFTGYAGGVINDDIIDYGPGKTHQIAFGWASDNGFGLAVALEAGAGDDIAPLLPPAFDPLDLYTIDSYSPHVVGGVGWQGAWGGVSVVAGYDSVWDQGAVKGRVDFYPTDRLALFAMVGWASRDEDYFDEQWYWEYWTPNAGWQYLSEKDGPNYYAPWGGSWAVWGGGSFMVTDKATFNLQASYDEMEDFAIVANLAYEVVPNFVVTPEIAYIDNFNDELQDWYDYWSSGEEDLPGENWGFFVRAQYNFGG